MSRFLRSKEIVVSVFVMLKNVGIPSDLRVSVVSTHIILIHPTDVHILIVPVGPILEYRHQWSRSRPYATI